MKARDRSPALERLLVEAQAAMQHEVSSRRKAVPGDGASSSARRALCERLRLGLIAIEESDGDYRDLLLTVAYHHVVASELGVAPAERFDEAADYARRPTADLFRGFGRRTDVTREAFGIRSL